MAAKRLRLLLVGGPMYDPLYRRLDEFEGQTGWEIEVADRLSHPALNARIADEFSSETARYDLISTHTKYAPSQRQWLSPLEDDLGADELTGFYPQPLNLARIDGTLFGVPRNLDVKLVYYRTDLLSDPAEGAVFQASVGRALQVPQTWAEFRDVALHFARGPELYGFAFPGRESGLFGHFFELQAMAGGRLFADRLEPAFDDDAGRWALGLLVELYRRKAAPPQTPDWHYDEVAACFRGGYAAMTTDWPGGFYTYTDPALCVVADRFDVAPYPVGPAGRRVYAGSHTFAIPTTVRDRGAAVALLRFLVSPESQLVEARLGSFPTRPAVLAEVRAESPSRSIQSRRWSLLEKTAAAALFPPAHPRYPRMEDALWQAARRALLGESMVDEALHDAAVRIRQIAAESE
jgi:multiple sugar transport system substrate-binding protein